MSVLRKSTEVPLIIGHRGGSGYLPEHTLEAYALGIELGADYFEPDLVATRDGYLIARHEPNMIDTTDVANRPEFAGRRRTVSIDGGPPEEGFFACDFSLHEIQRLRAVQPVAERDQRFNGLYRIPALTEIIELIQRKSREKGRRIGIYPETKHPSWHRSIGLPLEESLLAILADAGWDDREAPVFIQSFEQSNLKYLRARSPVRLIQLIDAGGLPLDATAGGDIVSSAVPPPHDRPYDWTISGRTDFFSHLATPEGLAEVRTYADGIGPWKRYIVGLKCGNAERRGGIVEADCTTLPPSTLVDDAHAAGLLVHPYTFCNEPGRLAADYRGDPVSEYLQFYRLGVDGVFSDFADTAVAARVMFKLLRDEGYAGYLGGDGDR